jgi:hypothetical protein
LKLVKTPQDHAKKMEEDGKHAGCSKGNRRFARSGVGVGTGTGEKRNRNNVDGCAGTFVFQKMIKSVYYHTDHKILYRP